MSASRMVKLYDSTLRDGAQGEGVTFSAGDKLLLAQKLDRLGVHYVEGGWPHPSRPQDEEFFRGVRRLKLAGARVVAFGSTRRTRTRAARDEGLRAMLDAGTRAVAIVGKSWDLHVREVLRAGLSENLDMIRESVAFVKRAGREVIFDAEHFFDGFRENPEHAADTIAAAVDGGADWVVLCDTNGGSLPHQVEEAIEAVRPRLAVPFGIHAHDDSGCAVANSLVAVRAGATQVQGTVNGFGERCGNANLCSIIPNLKVKLGIDCVSDAQLRMVRGVSLFVSELVTKPPRDEAPYAGASAFAHKGGIHVHAVLRNPRTYEHVDPRRVGNRRRVLVSDQSGLAAVRWKAEGYGFRFGKNDERGKRVLGEMRKLEQAGYQFEGAEASFELVVNRVAKGYRPPFELIDFRVAVAKESVEGPVSEATLKVRVGDQVEHTVAEGDGPVNALDRALRKALGRFYPELKEVHLADYKVRVINPQASTAAKVRVQIESTDGKDVWSTVGVSENIIEASWQALADSVAYKLLCLRRGRATAAGRRGK